MTNRHSADLIVWLFNPTLLVPLSGKTLVGIAPKSFCSFWRLLTMPTLRGKIYAKIYHLKPNYKEATQ